jgi:uncharacterized membrane protein
MNAGRNVLLLARPLLVAIGVAPFAPALFSHVPALGWLARALDAWFSFQCERDPARLLGVGAVCARCLGLYVGLGLGALVGRPRWATPRLEIWLGVAVLAMLVDVMSERLGWRSPSAPLRLVTGRGPRCRVAPRAQNP